MTPYFESDKENLLAIKDSLESAVSKLSIMIDDLKGLSPEEYQKLEERVSELYILINELDERIIFSN